MTPQERAQKSSEAMWANDHASKWFGMEIIDVDEGRAVISLIVAEHHCNGHGICHGGVTHALADSAFAFACNSRNTATVGQHTMMSYLAPARKGDLLTATATEVHLKGRSGVYDVRVTNQDNTVIAEFRGMSRAVGGQNFQE